MGRKTASNRWLLEARIPSGNPNSTEMNTAVATSADDVASMVVGMFDDRPVYLDDIAEVTSGAEGQLYGQLQRGTVNPQIR